MHKIKVGDTVRVRSYSELDCLADSKLSLDLFFTQSDTSSRKVCFNVDMKQMCDKEYVVKYVNRPGHPDSIRLVGSDWNFLPVMFKHDGIISDVDSLPVFKEELV